MKKRALFIINPVSGGKKKDAVPGLIKQHLDADKFDYAVIYTTGIDHARNLAADAARKYDMIVAVGGDGTINEVASSLVGTDTVLGVVPFGSGNGLSRFLSIPMDIAGAIKNLNHFRVETIDAGTVNGKYFFNMAGMGFDAHIAEVFSHDKKRGFGAYIKSAWSEVTKYVPGVYKVYVDDQPEYVSKAFMLSIANSSQYGNNAHISPTASVQDGMLDVCVVKPFPLYQFVFVSLLMFANWADKSKYVRIIKGKNITIRRAEAGPVHLDGEPQLMEADITIQVLPSSLNIVAGSNYKR